jgi:hypothetical protein
MRLWAVSKDSEEAGPCLRSRYWRFALALLLMGAALVVHGDNDDEQPDPWIVNKNGFEIDERSVARPAMFRAG